MNYTDSLMHNSCNIIGRKVFTATTTMTVTVSWRRNHQQVKMNGGLKKIAEQDGIAKTKAVDEETNKCRGCCFSILIEGKIQQLTYIVGCRRRNNGVGRKCLKLITQSRAQIRNLIIQV